MSSGLLYTVSVTNVTILPNKAINVTICYFCRFSAFESFAKN